MSPEWLRAFVVFAQTPSLEAAAEELNTTQPTLTRQLGALEESLGISLFAMKGRRKVLTQTGQELFDELRPRFEGLSESVERVIRRQSEPERMTLRLGARREILLAHALSIPFPGHLHMKFHTHAEIVEGLINRELDVGVTHELPDSFYLASKPLFREEFKLCYPKSWRIEHQSCQKMLRTLVEKRPFLAYDERLNPLRPLYPDIAKARIHRTCADWQLIASLVSAGVGWSVAPNSQLVRADLKNVEVIDLPKVLNKSVQFHLIYLKEFGEQLWFKEFVKALGERSF